MGLWSKIKSALSQGASNSSSTGTGNTSKPAATSTTTTQKTSTPTVTTSKTSNSSSSSNKTVKDMSGSNTAFSQAYQSQQASKSTTPTTTTTSKSTSNIINGSAGGFKAFDNSGQSANDFVSDSNNSAYVKQDTTNVSAGEGYTNNDGSAKLVTGPTNTNPTPEGLGNLGNAPNDVNINSSVETIKTGKSNDDMSNEVLKITNGHFTGSDGKMYGFTNSGGGIQMQELNIYKGLISQGFTEDQANEILNSAYRSKGLTRQKNYQKEDGTWTYSLYGDLNNEQVDKEEAAGKYKSLLAGEGTPTTITEAKNLLEEKLNSLADDYKKEYSNADKSESIADKMKNAALAKRLQQRGLAEAANFTGLGSGNRTQEQLAMDEAYRNKLMELREEEISNDDLLAKLKSQYDTKVSDANTAYEYIAENIKAEAAAKKAKEAEEKKSNAVALQTAIDNKIKEQNGAVAAQDIMAALIDALNNGAIDRADYNTLLSRYYPYVRSYIEGGE